MDLSGCVVDTYSEALSGLLDAPGCVQREVSAHCLILCQKELLERKFDLQQRLRMVLPSSPLIFYFLLENHFKESDVLVPDAMQLLLKEFGDIIENKLVEQNRSLILREKGIPSFSSIWS